MRLRQIGICEVVMKRNNTDIRLILVALGLVGLLCKVAAVVLAAVYWGWTGIAVLALYLWGEVALDIHANAYEEVQRKQRARMAALLFASKLEDIACGRDIIVNEDGFPVGFGEKEGDGE